MIKKTLKILLVIFSLLAFTASCIYPVTLVLIWWSSPLKENDWKSKTSPLSREVIEDICSKFDVKKIKPACKSEKDVYAPDLFPMISDTLLSKKKLSYDDVQLLLSQYQVDYEPPVTLRSGDVYFVSWYDLQGDGQTALVFFFNGDGSIREIKYHLGDFAD